MVVVTILLVVLWLVLLNVIGDAYNEAKSNWLIVRVVVGLIFWAWLAFPVILLGLA